MNEEEKIVIPTLKTLKTSISDLTDEKLDELINDVRASRRKLVSEQGSIKRKGKKIVKKEKITSLDMMSEERKEKLREHLRRKDK